MSPRLPGLATFGVACLFIALASLALAWPLWYLATTYRAAYSLGFLVLGLLGLVSLRFVRRKRGAKAP